VAVGAFLNGKIGFLDIASIVDTCLSKALVGDLKTIERFARLTKPHANMRDKLWHRVKFSKKTKVE